MKRKFSYIERRIAHYSKSEEKLAKEIEEKEEKRKEKKQATIEAHLNKAITSSNQVLSHKRRYISQASSTLQ